ncbi:MAG: DNA-binding protein [Candidatus Cloacimonetes bacterium]|nr:DNA-binding protein [Candidatus Cloacimonadota bacterium]
MQTLIHNDHLIIRLYPGQDLYLTLTDLIKTQEIGAACMVTCVGSLAPASVRLASAKDIKQIPGPLEIVSLVGTLGNSGLHLHLSVADRSGLVQGGHLQPGSLIHTTAEIVLQLFEGIVFNRALDPLTGYKELQLQ